MLPNLLVVISRMSLNVQLSQMKGTSCCKLKHVLYKKKELLPDVVQYYFK